MGNEIVGNYEWVEKLSFKWKLLMCLILMGEFWFDGALEIHRLIN